MKKNILIVEDEAEIRIALTIELKHGVGCHCVAASDRGEAMEILQGGFKPRLMLIDITMPSGHIAGLDLIRDLKAQEEWKRIPMVVLSARSESATILEAMRCGAMDYLLKPYEPSELLSRVERAFEAFENLGGENSTPEDTENQSKLVFRNLHTETMRLAVLYWELTTKKTKVDLAISSSIWTHSFDDDGTPRVRTMDRYRQGQTLPQKPKTHLVIQTAEYVLQNCESEEQLRLELEANLKKLRALLVESA